MDGVIVDSHCHLDFEVLAKDLDGVVARAGNAGVGLMVTICTRVRKFDEVLAIAMRHGNIFCTVGTHPHNAADETDVSVAELVDLARHDKVVGIGEAGLDYFYDKAPRDVQAQVFRRHIAAARETGLPLVIHSRDAEQDTLDILTDEMAKGAFKPLLHCFTSQTWLAEKCLELGAYVSFSGIVTFKNAGTIRDAAALVPMDKVLVETDAPYLAPVPHRGKSNEPAFTRHTLEFLAGLKDVSRKEMARATTANFFRLFDKVPASAVAGAQAGSGF